MSKSMSTRKSKSIGELATEVVGSETISVKSDFEVCTLGPKWHGDKQKRFDSEVSGDMNAGEKHSMKLFSIMVSENMLLLLLLSSSFSDPVDGEGKINDGNISSLSKFSTLTSGPDPKEKIFSWGCSIFSSCG